MNAIAEKQNIEALTSYFASGIKQEPGAVGIELEHTIVHEEGQRAVSYEEPHGIRWVLEQLLADYPTAIRDSDGDLLGAMRDGAAITLEPAAQLELSAGPFDSLREAKECFEEFEVRLAAIVEPHGMQVITPGYHPTAHAADLTLIPKQRYEFMNRYLGNLGPYGPCMMRGSASTQVSIDYTSEADCLRKLRCAYRIAPIAALVTDNAPVFEGKGRPHRLVRTRIWQECDPDRCGVVPGILESGFTWRDYASYVLGVPAILVPENAPAEGPAAADKPEWRFDERPFRDIYASRAMTRNDVEHALSMTFNDVRLKTYIELRPADAMPIPHAIAYAALVKGLFACEETLAGMEAAFGHVDEAAIEAAKEALMASGYDACIYGMPAGEAADALFDIARQGLCADEAELLEPLEALARRRITLADLAE